MTFILFYTDLCNLSIGKNNYSIDMYHKIWRYAPGKQVGRKYHRIIHIG